MKADLFLFPPLRSPDGSPYNNIKSGLHFTFFKNQVYLKSGQEVNLVGLTVVTFCQ